MAFYDLLETPLGTLFIGGSAAGLHRMEFIEDGDTGARSLTSMLERLERDAGEPAVRGKDGTREAARQVTEYLRGERAEFDLPLAPRGTAFQQRVWDALRQIPPGETRSYGEIAAVVGQPSASRAVGAANGRNPLIIVVPCHRVVGADGTLTGYGAGLPRKRWLLDHEARWLPLFNETALATA